MQALKQKFFMCQFTTKQTRIYEIQVTSANDVAGYYGGLSEIVYVEVKESTIISTFTDL